MIPEDSTTESIFSAEPLKESQKRPLSKVSGVRKKLPEQLKAPEAKKQDIARPDIIDELVRNKVPEITAKRIAEGFAQEWKGFVTEETVQGEKVFRQIHGIKGLKVYRDPFTQEIVADFGLKTLGQGGYKRAKLVARLTSEGITLHRVRYTKTIECMEGIEPSIQEMMRRKKLSEEDMEKELRIRAELNAAGGGTPVPHLLDIKPIRYISGKTGTLKTRYDTTKCDGDFAHLDRTNPTKIREGLVYCKDILEALAEMHRRGIIHKDVKLENIYFSKGKGVLADLGLACHTEGKEPCIPLAGSPGTMSPEEIVGAEKNSPAMDVFSTGLLLLSFSHPEMYEALIEGDQGQRRLLDKISTLDGNIKKFQTEIENLKAGKFELLPGKKVLSDADRLKQITLREKRMNDRINEKKSALETYFQTIRDYQEKLKSFHDPLDSLIANLLNIDPQLRPSSAQAKETFFTYLASPAFENRFGH